MKCDRCKNETNTHRVSWFNLDNLCPDCIKEENSHPDYKRAHDIVLEQEALGNRNYEGVGLPEDLRQKYNR